MLSLPPIVPRDHLLYNNNNNAHRNAPFQLDASTPTTSAQQQNIVHTRRVGHAQQSPLAQLRADENIIEQRKHNVRRFGAGWLRPPGVSKTLQSKIDEQHEQLEQMELQRRDAQLRAEEDAAQQAGMQDVARDEMGGEEEERNLDDDVPEAEDVALASDEGEDEADEDAEPFTSSPGASQLDYSLDQEQAELAREEAELDGRLQDERDLGMDRDLDDVPEAGSYEHTDTEEEDVSTDEDEERAPPPALRLHNALRSDPRSRTSLASEDLEGSSFLESSPAMVRRSRDSGPRNSMARRRRLS